MSWMAILKRVDIRNADEYERASLDDRKDWHSSQMNAFQRRLVALRINSKLELTNTEHPLYEEIVEYRDLRNFHSRQRMRIDRCQKRKQTECNDYYSIEGEGGNYQKNKLRTTPLGQSDPYTTISQESYEKLDNKQKYNYHKGLERTAINNNDLDNKKFHSRMKTRLYNEKKRNSELPTFSSIEGYVDTPELSGKRRERSFKKYTLDDYLKMDERDKRQFHIRMGKRKGTTDALRKFHNKMEWRLRAKSPLPTYFSPEQEQEAI